MPLELVDFNKTYELKYADDVKFVLRHWTNGMQDEVDRACVINKGDNIFSYDIAREREMRIDLSVQDWSGIVLPGETSEAPCTSENKRNLPVGVTLWLQKKIEERAGLRITEAEKKS